MKSKFYCDIIGTFNGGMDRNASLDYFVQLLKKLDDNDELNFSFVSSENLDKLKNYIDEFKPYVKGSKIIFGNQYSAYTAINNDKIVNTKSGKIAQICEDLDNSNYDMIYYAEDSKILREAIHEIVKMVYPDSNFTVFETCNGIDSLNNALQNHINSKKTL